jgi:hypothetical protein
VDTWPPEDQDEDRRWGPFRLLQLVGARGRFLRRYALNLPGERGGVMLHAIDARDPGLDVHDHPWWFVTLVLRGGYTEEACEVRDAVRLASNVYIDSPRGERRTWRRGSVHRMPLHVAHRIIDVQVGTWTLVVKGPKVRPWGFYMPRGWVHHKRYDYDRRRV